MVSEDAPCADGPRPGKLRSQLFGLLDEDPKLWTPDEDLVDLSQQDPRHGHLEQRQMTPRQLDPGPDRELRQGIGQARTDPLRLGQFGEGARPVSPVQGGPCRGGIHDRDQGVVLQVALTDHGLRLGQVPFGQLPCAGAALPTVDPFVLHV